MRASDADRERLVEVLKTGFAEGRLTQDEYTFRMERAYTAQTYGDLEALIVDLPGAATGMPHPAYGHPGYQAAKPNSLAVASLICGILELFLGVTAIPAIILGHKALKQIKVTGEPGRGLAKAGLILGWTAVGLFALVVALAVLVAVLLGTRSGAAAPAVPHGVGAQLLPFIHPRVRFNAGAGPR
jgi:DUF1707 SHOCT-like domain/Domain of unknown function (DUF4190)